MDTKKPTLLESVFFYEYTKHYVCQNELFIFS